MTSVCIRMRLEFRGCKEVQAAGIRRECEDRDLLHPAMLPNRGSQQEILWRPVMQMGKSFPAVKQHKPIFGQALVR